MFFVRYINWWWRSRWRCRCLVVMMKVCGCDDEGAGLWWWCCLVVMMIVPGCDDDGVWLMTMVPGCDDEGVWLWWLWCLVVMMMVPGCGVDDGAKVLVKILPVFQKYSFNYNLMCTGSHPLQLRLRSQDKQDSDVVLLSLWLGWHVSKCPTHWKFVFS